MDSERAKRILAALVREYIASGEPVPSSLLVSLAGVGVSSATVRSILARLEDEGFVSAAAHLGRPHPDRSRLPLLRRSAARVQAVQPYGRGGRSAAAARRGGALVDSVLSQVSHVVSQASKHVGFALRPAHHAAVFDRVEFVPLSSSRVLVVIVARGRPRRPEGHRDQRAARAPTSCARRPTTSTTNSAGCRSIARAKRCSSG